MFFIDNVVLKSIKCTNFSSFSETINFTMSTTVTPSQIVDGHTFVAGDVLLFNKLAYIYGANGAGKSNLCKILLEIQKKISLSPIISSENHQIMGMREFRDSIGATRNYFKFNTANENVPTQFGIELLIDNILYSYSFSVGKDNLILTEKLTKKKRRTEVILDRTSPNNDSINLKSELKSFESNVSVVKDKALCLSMASFLNNELAVSIVRAIENIKVVNMASMVGARLDKNEFSDDLKRKYLNILRNADKTLKAINVEFDEENIDKKFLGINDFENKEVVLKKISLNVESTHQVYEDGECAHTINLPFFEIESIGTIKLFNVLPTIFKVLDTGGILIMDEIENGLHPNVVKMIIDLFYNIETNPKNAQLICTTHSTQLVDNGVQKDEVWIIIKNEFGESELRHIAENSGLNSNTKFGQKMLMDAFGGMPQISID